MRSRLALGTEGKRFAVVTEVLCPALQVPTGVGEFEHARDDEKEVGFGVSVGGQDGNLLFYMVFQVCPGIASDFS